MSSSGSKRPRSRPTRIIASRSSPARTANRSVSSPSRPIVLTTSAPSKLSCAIALVSARRRLGPRDPRRHPARVDDVEGEQRREDGQPDQRERPVDREQGDDRGDQHDHRADRERHRRDREPGRLDVGVGVGQQGAGGVAPVPGQRQLQVAAGDPAPVGGLQAELHHAGAQPAAEDGRHLEQRHREDRGGAEPERDRRRAALIEPGHDDPADHLADHDRAADRQQPEQAGADHRDREDARLLPDRPAEHGEPGPQHSRFPCLCHATVPPDRPRRPETGARRAHAPNRALTSSRR